MQGDTFGSAARPGWRAAPARAIQGAAVTAWLIIVVVIMAFVPVMAVFLAAIATIIGWCDDHPRFEYDGRTHPDVGRLDNAGRQAAGGNQDKQQVFHIIF